MYLTTAIGEALIELKILVLHSSQMHQATNTTMETKALRCTFNTLFHTIIHQLTM
jgi:hypothetical protein